jgi:cyclophilin family peptidyl-prolyl cis-trans isomerase
MPDDVFNVEFECSNGSFTIEIQSAWAPLGAARFKELVEANFFSDLRFFRVVPNFIVQFGISGDPAVARDWQNKRIADDKVTQTNAAGTLTFATAGPKTRTTQLFINLRDNAFLDSQGFSPFGKVISGMEVVKAITAEYGEKPDQGQIQSRGNAYLQEKFPNLDFIKSAKIV